MKKIKSIIVSFLILTIIFATSDSYAQQFQKGKMKQEMKGKRSQGMRGKIANHRSERGGGNINFLDLTDEQKEAMSGLRVEYMKQMQAAKNEMAEKKARLRTLTTTEAYNQNAIDKVVDDISKLMATQMKAGIEYRQEVKTILTEEQLVKFNRKGNFGKRSSQGRKGNRMGRM